MSDMTRWTLEGDKAAAYPYRRRQQRARCWTVKVGDREAPAWVRDLFIEYRIEWWRRWNNDSRDHTGPVCLIVIGRDAGADEGSLLVETEDGRLSTMSREFFDKEYQP